jgi:hypothetical protein
MSNPREKAIELYEKFFYTIPSISDEGQLEHETSKQCSIIAIDEIIKVCPYTSKDNCDTVEQLRANDIEFVSYWLQVKEEIEAI